MLPETVSVETPNLANFPEVVEMAAAISAIESKRILVQKYRTVQSYQLTDLQLKLLSHIDESMISEAKLKDIVEAFKTLKTVEHMIEGKPTEIKGLVAYLVAIEKEDLERKDNVQDAVYEEVTRASV